MKNSALIIVDPQYDFMPGGALEVKDGDKIIPIVNKLIPKFDLIIITQDWHPRNHKSFASQHEGKKEFDVIDLNGIEQVLWPDHCIENEPGSRIHKDINLKDIKGPIYIFRKGIDPEVDSYSGFFDNKRKNSTGLSRFLKEDKNITDIYVTGLAQDFCAGFTALDGVNEGFNTYFVLDATRAIDPENNEMIEKLKENNVKIINSKDI